ncbi:MAG TPA: hypothetical protein VFA57_11535 [Pseudolabrys sp.]|nr:hypothetical protein [Pseudolabrys sp.]
MAEISAAGDYRRIRDVQGFNDRSAGGFAGGGAAVTFRLLNSPPWASASTATADLLTAADKELVANRLVGALNLFYEPSVARSVADGGRSRENTVGLGAGLMAPIRFYGGIEVR